MSRIEFISTEISVFNGKSKATGNEFSIRKQEAYLHGERKYPERFEVTLGRLQDGKDRPAYEPGFYRLGEASIVVNPEFKQLELSRYDTVYERLPESEQGVYAAKPVRAAQA